MSCPLCRQRKGRRACPAKDAEICAHCCGTKRRVEIDCPDGCVYLSGAHAPAWEGRETERKRDLRRVAPHIEGLGDRGAALFFLTLVGIQGLRKRTEGLDDRRLADALATLRKTYQTRERGIIYEHQADDLRVQALVSELKEMFAALGDRERGAGASDDDQLAVVAALEASAREAVAEGAGPAVFLDTAARLADRFAPGRSEKGRLIIAES
jgi:hypothetical protein